MAGGAEPETCGAGPISVDALAIGRETGGGRIACRGRSTDRVRSDTKEVSGAGTAAVGEGSGRGVSGAAATGSGAVAGVITGKDAGFT